jgi:spore maturation protein CgeB
MPPELRLAYLAHSLRSDWNHGNAHFLRGLLRAVQSLGCQVSIFERDHGWSIDHLRQEPAGEQSIRCFHATYPDLNISCYGEDQEKDISFWRGALRDVDVVILHEWNPPQLAALLLELREELKFRLLFHDTHHRASSSPEQIRSYGTDQFDGVLAFGEALKNIYRDVFGIARVWTLHEAADVTVFRPLPGRAKSTDVIWIGNWGDDERSAEIREFFLCPARRLGQRRFAIHGVRYPEEALNALWDAGVEYQGYLSNLEAPAAYAASHLTIHIPRQQYTRAMTGIPTIRVFEALACGIPLISAPWSDTEHLFREGDFLSARDHGEMTQSMERLLSDPAAAHEQAQRGMETILARHTCRHRAEQLLDICEEVLG